MKSPYVQRLVTAALFTALTCIATLVIQIHGVTGGYINFGDAIVLISCWVLSPFYGAAAAGIGSMLADLIVGAALFAPATLVIKAMMALFGGMVFRAITKKGNRNLFAGCVCSALLAESIMAIGYCAFEWVVLDLGAGALAGMPGNIVQAIVGGVSAVAVYLLMQRNTTIHSYLSQLK